MTQQESDTFLLPSTEAATLYACATFHLGFPLALVSTASTNDWNSLRKQLLAELTKKRSPIRPIRGGLTDVLSFPLGKPLMCALDSLPISIQQLDRTESGISGSDHRIIIFPTGTITFCYKALTPNTGQLKNWMVHTVEHQYAWLQKNFLEFCTHFYAVLNAIGAHISFDNADHVELLEKACRNGPNCAEANRLLNDVYYIEVLSAGNISDRITYTDATLRAGSDEWKSHGIEDDYNRERLLALIATHATISCAVWLDLHIKRLSAKHLSDYNANSNVSKAQIDRISLLKNFTSRFIFESEPISISITKEYYDLMRSAWIDWNMKDITEHLRQGLTAMQEFTNWINKRQTERRTALLSASLAFLSALTLISALTDGKNYLGRPYEGLFSAHLLWVAVGVALIIPFLIYGRVLPRVSADRKNSIVTAGKVLQSASRTSRDGGL